MSHATKAVIKWLLLFCVLPFILPCPQAAAENHPNTGFTFAERGEEIGRLYRLGLENNPKCRYTEEVGAPLISVTCIHC